MNLPTRTGRVARHNAALASSEIATEEAIRLAEALMRSIYRTAGLGDESGAAVADKHHARPSHRPTSRRS
jgi:hypothetical protein